MFDLTAIMPRADDAEQALLGSLLEDPGQATAVRLIVTEHDFANPLHGEIYSLVLTMIDAGEPVDLVTTYNKAVELDANEISGRLLADLANAVPSAANAEYYARIIAKAAVKREALYATWQAYLDLQKPDADPTAIMAALTQPSLGAQKQVLSASALLEAGEYQPFPVKLLPRPVSAFVSQASEAIGCDLALVALPLLAGLASAIGNTRRIRLKGSWSEPAIVWAVTVAESGDLKSPALEAALKAIRYRQADAMRQQNTNLAAFKTDKLRHGIAMAEWKKEEGKGEPPAEPQAPVAERFYTEDVTVEALACLLRDRWRGLLVARDELSGWLSSFDRYVQGKGGDAAKWIELHAGRPVVVDRKTGEPRTIFIPRAAVSLTGTIQPAVLQRALSRDLFENGLAARLLLACPPRRVRHWTDNDIDCITNTRLTRVFDRLFSLEPTTGPDGEPQPEMLPLTADAKKLWVRFYDEHAAEHAELSGDLSAAWSKLEGYAARLALVIQCCRWAADDTDGKAIDAQSMKAGIALSRWFGAETRRVYGRMAEDADTRKQRELVELIHRAGGTVTTRELMRRSRAYPTAATAETALRALVGAGLGKWEAAAPGEQGGRPSVAFRLTMGADADKTP